ncbi:hypothetical protein EH30_01115 [Erythrobacter sp. JL475]|nr:hypothetical protein EH30_01115 [Erythrobacter sp. JL475]
MSEASFASLGPTLLARKGGAKPAMRPQLAPLPEVVAEDQLEDLGWNDMGHDDATQTDNGSADVVSILNNAATPAELPQGEESPLVVRQQRNLADQLLANAAIGQDNEDHEAELIQSKPAPARKQASRNSRRAAFTLRLDTERHLKLRLAATIQGVSAQALVTEALDALLAGIEDLDTIAQRLNGRMTSN